jgi:7,8-dihydropterin-6-yl-methyl-4-(beta-D-ribofuranosyl)aminobenzene 5'-phosphate synthase
MRAVTRRQFLVLGAVAGSTFYLGGVGRFGRLAVARTTTSFAVPTVDRLVLTNVVDYVYDNFPPSGQSGELAAISVRRRGAGTLSEWGLAYHLESYRGDERREVLLDFARTTPTLMGNYAVLGIDPANADALILSHGHSDHYGALPDLGQLLPEWSERAIPLYAGGEDTFCGRWTGRGRFMGQLSREELESWGLNVVLAKDGAVIAGHGFTSGQIPRATAFEDGGDVGMRLEAGPPGSSCHAALFYPSRTLDDDPQPGDLVEDIFWGEHATAYHVQDRGLVVVSSCAHAGVINSIRQVQRISGIEKVHAIVGGWHLVGARAQRVSETVAAFKEIDPDYILPMHCAGFDTMAQLRREMPEKLILPSTGTSVVFGA